MHRFLYVLHEKSLLTSLLQFGKVFSFSVWKISLKQRAMKNYCFFRQKPWPWAKNMNRSIFGLNRNECLLSLWARFLTRSIYLGICFHTYYSIYYWHHFFFSLIFTWHEMFSLRDRLVALHQSKLCGKGIGVYSALVCLLWLYVRPIQPCVFVFMFTEKTLFSLYYVTSWRHHMHILSLFNTLPLTLFCHCTNIIVFFSVSLFQKLN